MEKNNLSDTEQQIYDDIFHAYIFAYPLVTTMLYMQAAVNESAKNGLPIPVNQLVNDGELWKPEDKKPGGPNMDTVYSNVKFDFSKGALIFHKPEMERFYTFIILDAYGNFVELIGSGGLAGRKEADFFLFGPDYSGEIPDNLIPVRIPTNLATGFGRTQIRNGESSILALQQQFTIKPFEDDEKYLAGEYQYLSEDDFDPYTKLRNMTLDEFFSLYNWGVKFNPPISEDQREAAKYEKYNIASGKKFILSKITQGSLKEKLEKSPTEWFDRLGWDSVGKNPCNGWGTLPSDVTLPGSDYYIRAISARWGIGCNPAKAAVYLTGSKDLDGNILNGKYSYKIHFKKEQIPPIREDGYWSISAYTFGDLLLIQNPYGIYKVGSESVPLNNEDGSIDIYISSNKPKNQKINNWLPVNINGNFEVVLRIYIPDDSALDGTWQPPVIERIPQ